MKQDDVQKRDIETRKVKKARLKQIIALRKFKALILIDLLILIIDLERIWKEINEMWLIEQAKKLVKKQSRSKLNANDKDDKDHEMIVDESWLQKDFVVLEDLNDDENDEREINDDQGQIDDDNEKDNERHARYAKNAVNSWDISIIDLSWR